MSVRRAGTGVADFGVHELVEQVDDVVRRLDRIVQLGVAHAGQVGVPATVAVECGKGGFEHDADLVACRICTVQRDDR